MELAPIPGYSRYHINGEDIINRTGKKLKPHKGKANIRYRLKSDDGKVVCKSIIAWRQLAGLTGAIRKDRNKINETEFFAKAKELPNGCWGWLGKKKNGYGLINSQNMNFAHQVAYFFKNNEKRTDLIHLCGNRDCINPDHIVVGTVEDRISIESKKHLTEEMILSPVTRSIAIDLTTHKVYQNSYYGLKEKVANYLGKYLIQHGSKKYYATVEELISGDVEQIDSNLQFLDRFWKKVEKNDLDDCWIWKGSSCLGYGQMCTGMEFCGERKTHRISYTLQNGTIPKGMIIMHTCDNPSCVNPRHLKIGTYSDNMQDMKRKGRSNNKKFPLDYIKIVRRYINEGLSFKDIDVRFKDYSSGTVYKYWKQIKDEM